MAGEKKEQGTSALHVTDGNKHVVGLKALRVHISPDGGAWFAQGLEVDYAAVGKSIDEAKNNFKSGLSKTIREHLRMHGTIEKLLQIAPQEAWSEFFSASEEGSLKLSFSMLDVHDLTPKPETSGKKTAFPFDKILFVEPEPAHVK